jgi:hypothetical protein
VGLTTFSVWLERKKDPEWGFAKKRPRKRDIQAVRRKYISGKIDRHTADSMLELLGVVEDEIDQYLAVWGGEAADKIEPRPPSSVTMTSGDMGTLHRIHVGNLPSVNFMKGQRVGRGKAASGYGITYPQASRYDARGISDDEEEY